MWQRFTERARRVVFFAQEEAGRLGENYVSTEHLLLGLVREGDSVAARILNILDISLARIRDEVEREVARADGRLGQDMQLTPRAKRVIDLAYDEARLLNNNYIGTEHLLLGLIWEGKGLAGRILNKLGVDLVITRAAVAALQDSRPDDDGGTLTPEDGRNAAVRKDILIRERIRLLLAGKDAVVTELEHQQEPVAPGDLGLATPPNGRTRIEVALDDVAFFRLLAIFIAKDTHGYLAMAEGDQTVFFLTANTPLKVLVSPSDSSIAKNRGLYVRVLSGDYEGYSGWILKTNFVRTGSDDSPFPPEISH